MVHYKNIENRLTIRGTSCTSAAIQFTALPASTSGEHFETIKTLPQGKWLQTVWATAVKRGLDAAVESAKKGKSLAPQWALAWTVADP